MILNKIRSFILKNKYKTALVSVTFVLITAAAIIWNQQPFRMIPLYVSLSVMILQAGANRYALLIGSLNSLIYAAVYLSLTLYSSAVYALLFSFPMQMISFINWSRYKYKNSTMLKKLTKKQIFSIICILVPCRIIFYLIFSAFSSQYMLLDNTNTLIGILASLLCMFSYMEYAVIQILSNVINGILSFAMMLDDPAQITYLIYGIYGLICSVLSYISMKKLYADQQQANR